STPGNHGVPLNLQGVLRALSSMRTVARPAAPRLIRLLEVRHDHTRKEIMQTLAKIGTDTDELVRAVTPLLLDPYADSDRCVAFHAGRLLVEVSPEAARREVSRLILQLRRDDGSIDKAALFALHALGPEARDAVPMLRLLLSNPDNWIADFTVYTLQD